MLSKVHCEVCSRDTIHYERNAGVWFYKVCKVCDKESLLLDDVWEEFERNEIKEDDISKELTSISFTKEQWEEIYQWYLVTKDDCKMEEFEIEAGEKIAKTLKHKYGTFR